MSEQTKDSMKDVQFRLDYTHSLERLANEFDFLRMQIHAEAENRTLTDDGLLYLRTALEHLETALIALSGLATGLPSCYSALRLCVEASRRRKVANIEWLEQRALEAVAKQEAETVH